MYGTGTTVIICIDGLDPEYLEACETPNLREIGKKGFLKTSKSMMPSVTNVNNVSIVTGHYPKEHGISSNYRLVKETGEEIYMESGDYINSETIFQRASALGQKSILVTSKDKLRTLLTKGANITVSSENAPLEITKAVGEPPEIYSLEVNGWVIRAGTYLLGQGEPKIVYLTTTDYAMHTFAPDTPQSQSHMKILDDAIGDLLSQYPDVTLLLTADHGMSSKSRMVDIESELKNYQISARAIPIIKDRYVVHHSNLGGCMFVYLEKPEESKKAVTILSSVSGVEKIYTKSEAVSQLHLYDERIGDLVVTGDPVTVFGSHEEVEMPPNLRSHASAHEQDIPIFGYPGKNGSILDFNFPENRSIGKYIFERVLQS